MSDNYVNFAIISNNMTQFTYDTVCNSNTIINEDIPYIMEWRIMPATNFNVIEYADFAPKNDPLAHTREYYIGKITLRIYVRCNEPTKLIEYINNRIGEYRKPVKYLP
jgi:hypothetical protein